MTLFLIPFNSPPGLLELSHGQTLANSRGRPIRCEPGYRPGGTAPMTVRVTLLFRYDTLNR